MARSTHSPDDRIEDIMSSIMAFLISLWLSMIVFGLGGSIVYGRYVPYETGIVLLSLLIGTPVLVSLATYVILRRRR